MLLPIHAADINTAYHTKLSLDWKTGVAASDWDAIAKKEHLDELSVEMRKVEGQIREIYAEMLQLQQKEQEMRDLNGRCGCVKRGECGCVQEGRVGPDDGWQARLCGKCMWQAHLSRLLNAISLAAYVSRCQSHHGVMDGIQEFALYNMPMAC
jgi:hypothetical protein